MVWYNPLTWSKEPAKEPYPFRLHCAAPQCKRAITTELIGYSDTHREVYHDHKCARLAKEHRALTEQGEGHNDDVRLLSRAEVLKLLGQGRIHPAYLELRVK